MPAKSKQQQKFMGIVRAIQKGDAPASKFSKDARDAAKDMSKSDVKKYAKTKHKGLPKKVKQELLDKLKKEYAFYHTGTKSRKRDYDDDNNLGRKKKDSGQPDLEEKRGREPEVISQLRDIVKRKQNKKIKDPKSGKMMRVDMYSASAVTKVYDAINKANKDKFGKLSLPKMVNVAFSVMKKENVVKNHDGKAAPYGSGYEKIDEVGVFPVQNYFKGILPAKSLDIMNDRDRERVKSLIKDLVATLNDFWKSHKIPFRVREPRKSDLRQFKKKNKRF